MNYYNEHDKFAAAWLRELIKAGLISNGEVDERSIEDVRPSELAEYKQCHFFAGIGGWSYALRLAGWPDDEPVWTGSCPCQPFSAAGKRGGTADERHLWPAFYHLIGQNRPSVIFGEQVASKDGLAWLDTVQADLAGAEYASAAVDLCAAGVGAPHIRQRLYFVADSGYESRRSSDPRANRETKVTRETYNGTPINDSATSPLADSSYQRVNGGRDTGSSGRSESSDSSRLVNSPSEQMGVSGCTWFDGRPADWLPCIDGKTRPVEPGTFPLAHGVSNRVGKLRGYGNAIVPQVAEAFIRSYMETVQDGII